MPRSGDGQVDRRRVQNPGLRIVQDRREWKPKAHEAATRLASAEGATTAPDYQCLRKRPRSGRPSCRRSWPLPDRSSRAKDATGRLGQLGRRRTTRGHLLLQSRTTGTLMRVRTRRSDCPFVRPNEERKSGRGCPGADDPAVSPATSWRLVGLRAQCQAVGLHRSRWLHVARSGSDARRDLATCGEGFRDDGVVRCRARVGRRAGPPGLPLRTRATVIP